MYCVSVKIYDKKSILIHQFALLPKWDYTDVLVDSSIFLKGIFFFFKFFEIVIVKAWICAKIQEFVQTPK